MTAAASSTIGGNRIADRLVDTRGVTPISGFQLLSGDTEYTSEAYLDANWLSAANPVVPVVLTFNLNGTFTLKSTKVWNYNDFGGVNGVGVETMEIWYSQDGGSSYTQLGGTFTLTQAPGASTIGHYNTPDIIALNTEYVTHVQFRLTDHYGGLGSNLFGLGQVQFFTPEPAAAAVLALGGVLMLRRSRTRRPN